MNPWLAIFAIPTFLQSLVVFLLSFPFWRRPVVVRRGLIIVAWRPWFAVRWMYSTTLGIIMGTHDPYNVSEQLLDHEVIHAHRQYVDMNVLGACIGGVVAAFLDWRWGLGIWLSSGMLWLLPNFLTGWIRYGDAYLGSEHERSAYAQTGRPL